MRQVDQWPVASFLKGANYVTEQQGRITGLAHIGIFTQDIDKSQAFYQDVLDFTLTNEEAMENGTRLAFLEAGTCIIELIQPGDPSSIADRPNGRVDHVAIAVEGIEALAERLKTKGVQFETDAPGSAPICGGIKNIFFPGPDGERLEFFETN